MKRILILSGRSFAALGKAVGLLLVLGYPFAVWFGLTHWNIKGLALVLGLVFLLRLISIGNPLRGPGWMSKALAASGILLVLASGILDEQRLLLYYPVLVNALLLILFAGSLLGPSSLVERLARLQKTTLSAAEVRYTRNVTRVWCAFFVFNGSLAWLTCWYGDMRIWALYNGGISYALIGTLMGTEWLIRKRVQRRS